MLFITLRNTKLPPKIEQMAVKDKRKYNFIQSTCFCYVMLVALFQPVIKTVFPE